MIGMIVFIFFTSKNDGIISNYTLPSLLFLFVIINPSLLKKLEPKILSSNHDITTVVVPIVSYLHFTSLSNQ
jgi:hypothetical protein